MGRIDAGLYDGAWAIRSEKGDDKAGDYGHDHSHDHDHGHGYDHGHVCDHDLARLSRDWGAKGGIDRGEALC